MAYNYLRKALAAAVCLTTFVVPVTSSEAGWIQSVGQQFSNFDEWRLDHTPAEFTGPRPGRDFTMLAVRNNTNRVVHVAASWIPWHNPHDNSSQLSHTGNSPWTHQAWYAVQPGHTLHFGNTVNGIFYIHALQEGTGATWGGSHVMGFPNAAQPLGCSEYRFIQLPREYTVNLNQ